MKNYASEYDGQVATGVAGYPLGQPRNAAAPGDEAATPLDAAWLADLWGWEQALLASAGVSPDGVADKSTGSQLWTSMLAAQGVLSSRDPRWVALLEPGEEDVEAFFSAALAELTSGGTLVILPYPGESTLDLTIPDTTIAVPAGATLVLGPGVTLVAGTDAAHSPILTLAAGSVLRGPGTVNCAADIQRTIELTGAAASVDGVALSAAIIEVTASDCVVSNVTGTGALQITGSRALVRGCALAPTIIDDVCTVTSDDVRVLGCAFHAPTAGGMGGSHALSISGDRCLVMGTTLRASLSGGECISGTGTDARISAAFLPGAGAVGSLSAASARFAGCPGYDNPQEPVRARGRVDSAGTLSEGFRVSTTSRPGTGQYYVTLLAGAVSTDYYSVIIDETSADQVKVSNKTTTGFNVWTANSSGSAGNYGFHFAVIAH